MIPAMPTGTPGRGPRGRDAPSPGAPPRRGGPSLAARAALAVGLTILFYATALGVAVGLLLIAYHGTRGSSRPPVRLIVFCAVGAGAILWGTLPRWERFTAPGPRLREGDHPRLFRDLRAIAKSVGQPMPEEVYLVADVNAGVLQRGGLLGFGGRRVMILGLPLMTALRTSEFRGVLAHEFGHFHGGETKLGPWIYRTQGAIGRTVRTLGQAGSWLHFLFLWYGKAFLRITLAVSRRQELAADRLAADVAGAPAIAGGLRRVHGASPAFDAYFQSEVAPVLSSGFRPPLAEGFRTFLQAREVSDSVERIVEEEARRGKGDPYDSHPPLRERLAALGDPEPVPPSDRDPPAADLLEGLEGLEEALLAFAFPGREVPPLLPWREAGESVWLPAWRKRVREERSLLKGLTPAALPAALARPPGDPRRKRKPGAPATTGGEPPKLAVVAATALLVHLADGGWTLRCDPGREVSLVRGEEVVFPFREVLALHSGETTAGSWAERCRLLGVLDAPLDAVAGGGEGRG
jgi:Zn-dependent protease with chaperone function